MKTFHSALRTKIGKFQFVKDTALFSLPGALLFLINFIAIPVLISISSLSYWSQLIIMQSIGALLGIFTNLGWNISIPVKLNELSPDNRIKILILCFSSRVTIFLIVISLTLLVSLICNTFQLDLMLALLSGLLFSLTSNWYFIANSNPKLILLIDTLPRLFFNCIGVFTGLYIESTTTYLFFLVLGLVIAIFTSLFYICQRENFSISQINFFSMRNLIKACKYQWYFVLIGGNAIIYTQTPVILANFLFSESASVFILSYKIIQLLVSSANPLLQGLQSWLNRKSFGIKNLQKAFLALTAILIALFVIGISNLHLFISKLSNGTFIAESAHVLLILLTFTFVVLSQHLGLTGLVHFELQKIAFRGNLLGATASIPLFLTLCHFLGPEGLLYGYCITEGIVTLWMLFFYIPRAFQRKALV